MKTPRTIATLNQMKKQGEKIAMLTCYDASFAHQMSLANLDVILVGDSLGNVIQGHESTIPVTIEEMIYHAKAVYQGNKTAFRLVDMPFGSYRNVDLALTNAVRLMQEGAAQMVKIEGGDELFDCVQALSNSGIPVCAHLGLLPQHIHKKGTYQVVGRDEASAEQLIQSALSLQNAGAAMILVECIPAGLAERLHQVLDVPLIGIGAGTEVDGQVLVLYDILGISKGHRPKFSHDFMAENRTIQEAISAYIRAVKAGTFPTPTHIF